MPQFQRGQDDEKIVGEPDLSLLPKSVPFKFESFYNLIYFISPFFSNTFSQRTNEVVQAVLELIGGGDENEGGLWYSFFIIIELLILFQGIVQEEKIRLNSIIVGLLVCCFACIFFCCCESIKIKKINNKMER